MSLNPLLQQWRSFLKKGKYNPDIKCPYCGKQAKLVTGYHIYRAHRPDLNEKWFWLCTPCKAYVGCIGYSTEPLGTLANYETRKERKRAHEMFDPLWKSKNSRMSRTEAYKWLSNKLGLTTEECHIGKFDAATCRKVVETVKQRN